jgi:hypothetical protein
MEEQAKENEEIGPPFVYACLTEAGIQKAG